ncbi:hypothetical protein [Kineococcus gypseus]|uniref:hypothetical protein n=1 Tax=Kineococcus gypseus TaxID=1637102 RepID=UPI003D7EF7A2
MCAAPAFALTLIAGSAPSANAFDRGVVVDTKNGGNARVRSAPSTGASEVATLPNGARLPDAECLVRTADSTAWTKLSGDRYIRADLTGFDTRLPACEQPAPPRSADSVDRPIPAERGEEEYEYHYRFLLGAYTDPRTLGVTPESATAKILDNFDEEFLYRDCGPRVWGGKQCELDLPGPFNFPIKFDRTWPTGWEFTSLDGTEEGARRWIKFELQWNEAGDRLILDVHAKGPRSALLTSRGAQPFNALLTSHEWHRLADKVTWRNHLCERPWWALGAPCVIPLES